MSLTCDQCGADVVDVATQHAPVLVNPKPWQQEMMAAGVPAEAVADICQVRMELVDWTLAPCGHHSTYTYAPESQ